MQDKYILRFLPKFYEDLDEIVFYICDVLNNKSAAERLLNSVEAAIMARLPIAESFEAYRSLKNRRYPYYRIYVNNYIIFYVIIEVADQKIMEVRRILYRGQNRDKIL